MKWKNNDRISVWPCTKKSNRENIPANAYTHTCTLTYMYTHTYKMPLELLK